MFPGPPDSCAPPLRRPLPSSCQEVQGGGWGAPPGGLGPYCFLASCFRQDKFLDYALTHVAGVPACVGIAPPTGITHLGASQGVCPCLKQEDEGGAGRKIPTPFPARALTVSPRGVPQPPAEPLPSGQLLTP